MSPRSVRTKGAGTLRLVRDYAALSGGEVVGRILGFAVFAYLARVLDQASYGAVELAAALSLFFAMFIDFGLGPIGVREIARTPQRMPELAAQIPALRLSLAFLAVPVMGFIGSRLMPAGEVSALIWLYALALLGAPFSQRWLFQGVDRMAWASAAQVVRVGVFALGTFLLVHGSSDLIKIGVIEIAAMASLAVYFLAVQQLGVTPVRVRFAVPAMRRLFREAAPIGISQWLWALNQYLPIALVASLLGATDTALFGAAHRVVLALSVFAHLYHFNLFPEVARRLGESALSFEAVVRPSFRVTAWAGAGLALLGTLLAEPGCRWIYGESFGAAGRILAILVWTLPVQLLSGHARWALIANGQQRSVVIAHSAGAVVTLALGWILIPQLGLGGGALAMLVSSIVIWVVADRYARRLVGPLPSIEPALRPLVVAAALAAGHLLHPWPWWTSVLAVGGFALAPLVLDRALLGAVRQLVGVKDAESATPAPPQPPREVER